MELKVIKRDGSQEPFSLEKIHKVVVAAGLTEQNTQTLLANMQKWAECLPEKTVTSIEIRDKVLSELTHLDTYVANLFKWYQKTKDKHK